MTILAPLLVALVGLLMFVLCSNPKLVRIGEILFCVGIFWSVQMLGQKTLHFG